MSRVAPAVPAADPEIPPDPRRWLALTVVLAAPLMAIFGQFVVNVAIATMQRDLRAGREPELDAVAGAVLRAAGRRGVHVPTVGRLAARVRERAAR